jgi:HSP20 family molecular chaperone IbpA
MLSLALSLNVLGVKGTIGACLQTLDDILGSSNTFNNENMSGRQLGYQVDRHDTQLLPSTPDGDGWSQPQPQPQPQQQLLGQLQDLLQQILQLVQVQQPLQQPQIGLQQPSQSTQQPLQMPSLDYGINTSNLLDDNTGKLAENKRLAQSPKPIKKRNVVVTGTNARPGAKKTEVAYDIIEGNGVVEAIVDMRGIRKQKNIITSVYNGNQLIISNPAKTYNMEITLPTRVVSEPVDKIYKNGILTLKFEKLD